MRAASMRPVSGPASTATLAASGGLNLPGRDAAGATHINVPTTAPVHEPIPGERDPHNLTHREAGSMGTPFGDHTPPQDPHAWLDEPTAHDRMLEGGGGDPAHHARDGYAKRER